MTLTWIRQGNKPPYLVYNKFKFREGRTLCSSLVSWRCCAKDCSAWIKTDLKKSKIVERKAIHNHAPPVIPSANSTPSAKNINCNFDLDATATTEASLAAEDTSNISSPPASTSVNDDVEQLERENASLKVEVQTLKQRLSDVTAHAISSDSRLLQYTDQVFVCSPSGPTTSTPSDTSYTSHQSTINANSNSTPSATTLSSQILPSTVERKFHEDQEEERECRPTHEIQKLYEKLESLSQIVEEQSKKFAIIDEQLCLKTEEYNKLTDLVKTLSEQIEFCNVTYQKNNGVLISKKQAPSVQDSKEISFLKLTCNPHVSTRNRFSSLQNMSEEEPVKNVVHPRPSNSNKTVNNPVSGIKPCLKGNHMTSKHDSGNYVNKRKIVIIGDSQSRNVSQTVRSHLPNYDVTGFCYSGAKLKDIITSAKDILDKMTKRDTVVLLGGTNDVNYGLPYQLTIRKAVCALLQAYRGKINIIISYIPYRYDIDKYNINDDIFVANLTLRDAVIKSGGEDSEVHVIDVNWLLTRRDYTRHGLHYNHNGKIKISKAIVGVMKHTPELSSLSATCYNGRSHMSLNQRHVNLRHSRGDLRGALQGEGQVSRCGDGRRGDSPFHEYSGGRTSVQAASTPPYNVGSIHSRLPPGSVAGTGTTTARTSPLPACLPHDSYADAVKSPLQPRSSQSGHHHCADTSLDMTPSTYNRNSSVFLTHRAGIPRSQCQ